VVVEGLVAAVAEAVTVPAVVAVVGNAESVVAVAVAAAAAHLSAVAESVAVAAAVRSPSVAACPCYSGGRQSAGISPLKWGSLLPPL